MTGTGPEPSEEFRAVGELAEAFLALVEELTAGRSRLLDVTAVVEMAARCIPGAGAVGVVVSAGGGPQTRTVAATGPEVGHLDRLRTATGEGPALDVLEVNDVVQADDLAADPRWPRFGPRVVDELGVRSMVCYRLVLGRSRAALVGVSTWPYAFDQVSTAIGAIFAAYCSLAVAGAGVDGAPGAAGPSPDGGVPHARTGQVAYEIGAAVGILMASRDLSHADAYAHLHRAATRLHGDLHAAAVSVVDGRAEPTGA